MLLFDIKGFRHKEYRIQVTTCPPSIHSRGLGLKNPSQPNGETLIASHDEPPRRHHGGTIGQPADIVSEVRYGNGWRRIWCQSWCLGAEHCIEIGRAEILIDPDRPFWNQEHSGAALYGLTHRCMIMVKLTRTADPVVQFEFSDAAITSS